ncbi:MULTISPECIES: GNAT family N-acetyltransferase [unclassified Streptomyces]|uniref:GNAT family N-acetyltransferase n=1 Tax=unclassified Streptomyces TaxID=2593676 RepID=UPI0022506E92|nr:MULTISPECIES: GNAT family N-acetyltransferase [unclassified Streptomyces]MCX4528268.1 GNAT family N-acetyltransferase [Streptomyces sp. NBC_01551]MCX4541132.1 GNAT family N-acetyltransferase [Streptomyces sp. NBC_01565]
MNLDELTRVRAEYDARMRRGASPDSAGARVERVGAVVRQTAPEEGWNGVLWSDLDEATADAEIAAQVAHYRERGVSEFEWKLYDHDRPADLGERLRAAGFVAEPAETLMVGRTLDLARLPVEPPEGITLRVVTDEAGVDLMMAVHAGAFGTDRPRIRHLLLTLLRDEPETIAAVVAMAGDTPVSAARMEMRPGTPFAGLWGGGTLPGWRGRGIYRLLVAHRARIAADLGIPYLQVDASDDSRPILHRLGFATLGVTTPHLHTREA